VDEITTATWASVGTIGMGSLVALYGIFVGNSERRKDRASALISRVHESEYKRIMLLLLPFGALDLNRTFHIDSWTQKSTLPNANYHNARTGSPVAPLPLSVYGPTIIELYNFFDEYWLNYDANLVHRNLLLDSIALIVLTLYYCAEPNLASMENQSVVSFVTWRKLALACQRRMRKTMPGADTRLLNMEITAIG